MCYGSNCQYEIRHHSRLNGECGKPNGVSCPEWLEPVDEDEDEDEDETEDED